MRISQLCGLFKSKTPLLPEHPCPWWYKRHISAQDDRHQSIFADKSQLNRMSLYSHFHNTICYIMSFPMMCLMLPLASSISFGCSAYYICQLIRSGLIFTYNRPMQNSQQVLTKQLISPNLDYAYWRSPQGHFNLFRD